MQTDITPEEKLVENSTVTEIQTSVFNLESDSEENLRAPKLTEFSNEPRKLNRFCMRSSYIAV